MRERKLNGQTEIVFEIEKKKILPKLRYTKWKIQNERWKRDAGKIC